MATAGSAPFAAYTCQVEGTDCRVTARTLKYGKSKYGLEEVWVRLRGEGEVQPSGWRPSEDDVKHLYTCMGLQYIAAPPGTNAIHLNHVPDSRRQLTQDSKQKLRRWLAPEYAANIMLEAAANRSTCLHRVRH